jgi:hypothetical protein
VRPDATSSAEKKTDNGRMMPKFFLVVNIHRDGRGLTAFFTPYNSPSDFYLFGKVQSALIGRGILDKIDLLEAVSEILNSISDVELQLVFGSWPNVLKG